MARNSSPSDTIKSVTRGTIPRLIASSSASPTPDQSKKYSTTGRLASEKRSEVPSVFRIGIRTLRRAWRSRTTRQAKPLARAVRI
jgi:hypothetical protein